MAVIHDEIVRLVRVMIQDLDSVSFSDDRLRELIATAGRMLVNEVGFDTTYTISVLQRSISPDPVGEEDESFINLISLKAACILDVGSLRTEAQKDGLKIIQDKSSIQTTGRVAAIKSVLDMGWCKAFTLAKEEFLNGQSAIAGQAIMTPFRDIDGFPSEGIG